MVTPAGGHDDPAVVLPDLQVRAVRSSSTRRPRSARRSGSTRQAAAPVVEQVARRPLVQGSTAFDEHQPVAHLLELAQVVRRDQHRPPTAGQAPDQPPHLLHAIADRGRWPARRGSAVRGHRAARRRCRGAASCRASSCGTGPPRGRRGPTCSSRSGIRPRSWPPAMANTSRFSASADRWVERRALDRALRRRGGTRRGRSIGRPSTVPVPAEGRTRPSSMAIVVVLPAPFGPMKPATTPRGQLEVEVVDHRAVARTAW